MITPPKDHTALFKYKILLVDDKPENLIALSAILKYEGYSCDVSSSGMDALALLGKNTYGLIILDVKMPGMNGFQLAEKIKADTETSHIPLIFLTANVNDRELFTQAFEAGGLDYLSKPVDEKLLFLKVRNFLQLYHSNQQLTHYNELYNSEKINEAILRGDDFHAISKLLLDVLRDSIEINFSRLYMCDTKNNKLTVLSEYNKEEPFPDSGINFLQNEAALADRLPGIKKNIIISDENEIKTLFGIEKGDTTNTMGLLPIFAGENIFCLMAFSSPKILSNREKDMVTRFATHAATVLTKKKSEQELFESEAFNKGILAVLPSHLAVVEQDGTIIAVNEAWRNFAKNNGGETTLQRTQEGSNYFEVCLRAINQGDVYAKNAIKGLKSVLNNEAESFEMDYPCDSVEQKRWFNLNISAYQGSRLRAVVRHLNISAYKEAEAEREKMIVEIMERNKNLEQFSYMVSHNLRVPVANIIGLSDLIQSGEVDNAEKKEVMEALDTSVKKLDAVIKDLNHILHARQSGGESKQPVRFSKLVEDIKLSINHLLFKKDITITYNFSSVEVLDSYKSYLYSIFFNLILNSIKYRRQDVPLAIHITGSKDNDIVKLVFEDNGSGIDLKRYGTQLFAPYKRFHSNIEGKGLGLFMVKTHVETLHGKIEVASEVNKGTAFTIEF